MTAKRDSTNTVASLEPAIKLRTATITGRVDHWFFVQEAVLPRLKRAASCLIEPQLGDVVLICDLGDDQMGYITAVLHSAEEGRAIMALPGGAKLTSSANGLDIEASQIGIKGDQSICFSTAQFEMNAAVATVRVSHWKSWSETIESHVVRATLFATSLTSHIGTAVSRLKSSWRKVDGLDEMHAGRSRILVDGQHKVEAQHVTVNAQGYVRIDGKKIDLG